MKATTFEMLPEGAIRSEQIQDLIGAARTFSKAMPDGTTLAMYRDGESSTRCFATFPEDGQRAEALAKQLAQAVKARAVLVEDGWSLASPAVARVRVRSNRDLGQSTLANSSPDTFPSEVAKSLSEGEWVAFALRRPTRAEQVANAELRKSRGQTQHYSRETGAAVASIYAGAASAGAAKQNAQLAVAAMPGIDVDTRVVTPPSKLVYALIPLAAAAVLGALSAYVGVIFDVLAQVLRTLPVSMPPSLPDLLRWGAIAFAVLALGVGVGVIPSLATRRRRLLDVGRAPTSMRRWTRHGVKMGGNRVSVGDGGELEQQSKGDGEYPLFASGLILHPVVMLSPAMPHGDSSFATATAGGGRRAPAALRELIGPVVAADELGPIRLSAADAYAGAFVLGEPGSGKSYLLEAIWGWWCMVTDRSAGTRPASLAAADALASAEPEEIDIDLDEPAPTGRRSLPAAPAAEPAPRPMAPQPWADVEGAGAERARRARAAIKGLPKHITLIGFDTKGDAASTRQWSAWASKMGLEHLVVDFAEVGQTFGIELFPMPKDNGVFDAPRTPKRYAENVVDALKVAFGEDAIGPRSWASLIAAFEVGAILSMRPHLVPDAYAELRGSSPWKYASVLLGNSGDEKGQGLADGIFQAAATSSLTDPWIESAQEAILPMYGGGVTATKRRDLFDAPRTKVLPLLAVESWWSRPVQASWAELLEAGRPIILNFGQAPSGHRLSDTIREQMSAFVLYSLREAIIDSCSGWQSQGKAFAVFADEVKHLAGEANDEVLSWLRVDGRSFGANPHFATQFPSQLTEEVRNTMLGYGTRIVFRQQNELVREQIARNVSTEGVEWTGGQVESLRAYTPIIKTTVANQSVAGFTAQVPEFAKMSADEFEALQLGAPR